MTTQFHLKNGASVVFGEQVLPYLKENDQKVLQIAFDVDDTSRCLKELSPRLKDCLLAIGGAESADLMGVDPGSCSFPFLDLSHFKERPIKFSCRHISQLPQWTTGKQSGQRSGDRIVVERILGPPYLQGDHKAVDPKGALDFALSAILRDCIWVDSGLAFVSPEYQWDKLYMAERGSARVFQQVLNGTIRFGMGDDTRTYGETGTMYKASASAQFRPLKEISGQCNTNSIAIGGPHSTILRPGLAVVIDPPLSERAKGADLEVVYGSIVAIDTDHNKLTIRLLLSRDNMPDYVLSNLGPNELVQTNALWDVPFEWVSGTFPVLPPQLFNAECIPQKSETQMTNKFLSRIVVCDMQILPDDMSRFSGSEDEITVSCEIFQNLVRGQLRLTLSRLKPFPAQAALAYLHRMNELEGGLSPPALAYRCNLGQALITFARQKAAHQRSAKDQLSLRPDVPGRALMELLYRTIKPDDTLISIRNGVLMVEVKDLDALTSVFGTSPSSFDLRGEGLGVVEFLGPFVFKWSMYDTVDPWGPLAGSVSISVGSFTEYNRMGTDVIKSSRCHPDALRASGIKAPAQKRARTSQTSSETRRMKLASQAQEQADQRRQRQASRSAMSAGGSGAESMTPSDERDGQPPYNSDSQSGGEGPASAYSESPADRSSSQSVPGFPDGDLMELVDSLEEDWLNAPAESQGELRGDGPAAPA
jgi:hypothetical protein